MPFLPLAMTENRDTQPANCVAFKYRNLDLSIESTIWLYQESGGGRRMVSFDNGPWQNDAWYRDGEDGSQLVLMFNCRGPEHPPHAVRLCSTDWNILKGRDHRQRRVVLTLLDVWLRCEGHWHCVDQRHFPDYLPIMCVRFSPQHLAYPPPNSPPNTTLR